MEHVVESIEHDLSHQHMELDTYLKTLKKEKEKWLEEDIKPVAIRRLEQSLVMDELSKEEKLEVKNEELQEEFQNIVAEMQYGQDLKKLQKQLKNQQFTNALAMEAATRLINRHLQDRLKEIASGKAEEKVENAAQPEEEKIVKAKKSTKKSKL